jgi:hypothetical protein
LRLSPIGTVFLFLFIASSVLVTAPRAEAAADTVLAEIAGRRITAAEFERQWIRTAPAYPDDVPAEERKRRFLDELINKEALSLAANEGGFVPSPEESALLGLTRLMSMRAAYYRREVVAPALAGAANPHAAHSDPQVLERQLRNERALIDRLVDPLRPEFDDSTLAFLAQAFQRLPKPREQGPGWIRVSMNRWAPPVRIRDTSRVVARSAVGTFTVGRFLWHWAQVPVDQRDRPDAPEQVREWTRSFLAQGPIDEEARRAGFAKAPEVVEEVRRRRELMAVERYYQRRILAGIEPDDAVLRAYWERDRERFHGMARHESYALWYPTREEAERAAAALRREAPWDSLLAARFPVPESDLAPGFGTEAELYREAQSLMPYSPDSTLRRMFEKARPGEVLGPRDKNGQWWVYRFVGFLDGRRNTFEEARSFVRDQWKIEEGERRLRAHLRELRDRYGVRLYEPAIAALTLPGDTSAADAAPPLAPGPNPSRPSHGHSR